MSPAPAAWVFQARPGPEPSAGEQVVRCVRQHRARIRPGDRVWFRRSGSRAAVHAVGRVLAAPRPDPDRPGGWCVDVVVDAVLDPPLLRAQSDADPLLAGVRALQGLMGTNLAQPPAADARLADLLSHDHERAARDHERETRDHE